jgi:glycine oxidase
MKVLVAGTGLTGAYSSYLLARAGFAVTCIGPTNTRGIASYNNPGGLNPLHGPGIPGPMSDFAMDCQRLHFKYGDEIGTASGIAVKFQYRERLMLAVTSEEEAALTDAEQLYCRTDGFHAEWLDSRAIKQLPLEVSSQVKSALITSGNATVDSAAYTRALLAAAQAEGAELLDGGVLKLESQGNRISVLDSTLGSIEADVYLFCTGPYIQAGMPPNLPVKPQRGDMLRISLQQQACPWDITWRGFGLYRIDRKTVWLGGTREDTGYDTEPAPGARHTIMAGLPSLLPMLADRPQLEQCCGLRPVTPDGLPVIGRLAEFENGFVATGAGAKGVLYSAGIAHLVTALINGSEPADALALFTPERFRSNEVLPRA